MSHRNYNQELNWNREVRILGEVWGQQRCDKYFVVRKPKLVVWDNCQLSQSAPTQAVLSSLVSLVGDYIHVHVAVPEINYCFPEQIRCIMPIASTKGQAHRCFINPSFEAGMNPKTWWCGQIYHTVTFDSVWDCHTHVCTCRPCYLHMWQFQIEIEYCSVAYFEHITKFDTL